MSLVPRCDRCGGLEVINGPMGRSMESRCKCNEQDNRCPATVKEEA
jgi:hypothetical protein